MEALDIVIGLTFIYLVLGLVCTTANEFLAGLFGLRSRTLLAGLKNLLQNEDDEKFLQNFLSHPLIASLRRGKRGPSYIPSRTFSLALLDTLEKAPGVAASSMDRVSGWYKRRALQLSGLSLGWTSAPASAFEWWNKILGLLITSLATSLGAPFWFVLKKFMMVRSAGRKFLGQGNKTKGEAD